MQTGHGKEGVYWLGLPILLYSNECRGTTNYENHTKKTRGETLGFFDFGGSQLVVIVG